MRKIVLMLLKTRLPMDEIREMIAFEANDYLDAWADMNEPKKPKKYLVLRKKAVAPSTVPKMPQPGEKR